MKNTSKLVFAAVAIIIGLATTNCTRPSENTSETAADSLAIETDTTAIEADSTVIETIEQDSVAGN
jgi:hypothetical protein